MRRIIEILAIMWTAAMQRAARKRMTAAERRAASWKRDVSKLLREIHRSERRLEKSVAQVNKVMSREEERCTALHNKAENLVKRFESVEEALTAELKIYRENIVPTQALGMESLRSQVEADIALQSQRRAVYEMPSNKSGA